MSQISFIHGFHAIIAKLRHQPDAILEIFIDAERHDARVRDLMRHAELHSIRVVPVDTKRLEGMAGGGMRHQGVVARVSSESRHVTLDDVLDTLEEPAFLLVLDGVQDPHNLGACLRVADAVGAHAVIAPKDRAVGLTQTAIKVASGAAESVPYITVTNLARTLRELKEREIWVVGTDAEAKEDLYTAKWPVATASAPSAMARSRTAANLMRSLQRTHGFGVRPAAYSATKSSITSAANCSDRSHT